MTNNSDGLSPTLRPQLGIGWNRALPAPFGFDNGMFPDGVNDYMSVPNLIGKVIPNNFTVVYWTKFPATVSDLGGVFRLVSNMNLMISRSQSPLTINTALTDVGTGISYALPSDTKKGMVGFGFDLVGQLCNYFNPAAYGDIAKSIATSVGATITKFEFYTAGDFTTQNSNAGIDEFRFYKKRLTKGEYELDYNGGVGNNPFETENLLCWFKFEQFETLDFSALQDGSDMRLGIRDLSGNKNHGLPVNMDTTPASPTYVLKPF